jgi:hypothetical protein
MNYVAPYLVTGDGYPDPLQQDFDSSSPFNASTSINSTPTRSLSSSSPTRGYGKGPMHSAVNGSPDESPLKNILKKGKKKIRESDGVKSKAKTGQMCSLRDNDASSSFNNNLEMVECQWTGCTARLHVDFVNVKHWGRHVREHYLDKLDAVECEWEGGCGMKINKGSLWKHIIVHESRFKIRCPRRCGVFTRSDMMKRHLRTCPKKSARAAAKR